MPEPAASNPRVAVIGLGSMGFGMATSLRRAGFEVTGCDVAAETVARFVADGGRGAKTPAEAARGADIVVSVVVSQLTAPKPVEELAGLVYSETPKATRTDPEAGSLPWFRRPTLMAGISLVMVIALNVIFR